MRKDTLEETRMKEADDQSPSFCYASSVKLQCKGIFAARWWEEIIDRKNEKTFVELGQIELQTFNQLWNINL